MIAVVVGVWFWPGTITLPGPCGHGEGPSVLGHKTRGEAAQLQQIQQEQALPQQQQMAPTGNIQRVMMLKNKLQMMQQQMNNMQLMAATQQALAPAPRIITMQQPFAPQRLPSSSKVASSTTRATATTNKVISSNSMSRTHPIQSSATKIGTIASPTAGTLKTATTADDATTLSRATNSWS